MYHILYNVNYSIAEHEQQKHLDGVLFRLSAND